MVFEMIFQIFFPAAVMAGNDPFFLAKNITQNRETYITEPIYSDETKRF